MSATPIEITNSITMNASGGNRQVRTSEFDAEDYAALRLLLTTTLSGSRHPNFTGSSNPAMLRVSFEHSEDASTWVPLSVPLEERPIVSTGTQRFVLTGFLRYVRARYEFEGRDSAEVTVALEGTAV